MEPLSAHEALLGPLSAHEALMEPLPAHEALLGPLSAHKAIQTENNFAIISKSIWLTEVGYYY